MRIAAGQANNNEVLDREAAVNRLLRLEHTPNVWFGASALDGNGYGSANCLHTSALYADVDVGSEGHKKPSFFDTVEDALSYILTAPVIPTCIWFSGHGVQVMYRLDKPYVFPAGEQRHPAVKIYKDVSRNLAAMLHGDSTITPEHLYRVPMTINAKPGLPLVNGRLLFWDKKKVYSFETIRKACEQYDIPESALKPVRIKIDNAEERKAVPYEQLPESIRVRIESSSADRSGTLFKVVLEMWLEGYADSTIIDAVRHGHDFREKYAGRFDEEILRIMEKVQKKNVYADIPQPLTLRNLPTPVPLTECAALPEDLAAMLAQYAKVTGITLSDRIQQSAQFHEHLFRQHKAGVMETPCGFGKTTWALAHIALNATADNQYMFVTDTIDGLYRAAGVLEQLNPKLAVGSIGRYHGFNAERCHKLCGKKHTWEQCCAKGEGSVCKRCEKNHTCAYYNREAQLAKPAVVMCHNGLLRLMECNPAGLKNVTIIVDEDLKAFLTGEFRLEDIKLVQKYGGGKYDIGTLFPYSTLSAAGINSVVSGKSFAALNYVFCGAERAGCVEEVISGLQKALGTGHLDPFKHTRAETEHAADVVLSLINVFRPTARRDSVYAFREVKDSQGTRYIVKKSRFDFGAGIAGRRMWMLNASAELCTTEYPAGLPVFKCPDLQADNHLATLHVIAGNPTAKNEEKHIAKAIEVIRQICVHRKHKSVFIAVDRNSKHLEKMKAEIPGALGEDTEIVNMARGRIRGSNDAGQCTLACLAGMSFFTTLDNVALSTAIALGRTFSVTHVLNQKGIPVMPGGRFTIPTMREIFALSALDEMYQAIWRCAIRNGKPAEVIVVMPDAEWLSALWRTVMPGFSFNGGVYTAEVSGFKLDKAMSGLLQLMMQEAGTEYEKNEIATLLGYSEKTGWKDSKNRARMNLLLEPFFEVVPGSAGRKLRRK